MHSFLLYQFLIQEILSDEQQFTILWQCPKFIGYEKLEFVYLITDFLHLWSYRVVICYCLLALTLYLIGYLAGIYQCLYTTLYCLGALGYLTDNLHVAGCQLLEIPVCGTAFSQLAGKKLSLSELSTYPLISLGKQTKTYESYSEWFRKNNCDFTPDIEAATADQILPMVKNNLGIGFVPEEFLEEYPNQGIISLELQETVPSRQVCYLRKKGHTMSVACREMEKMILSVSEY